MPFHLKAQVILTTNYDTFIQDSYNEISNYNIKTYIGQRGFFEQTIGYAELYKLHGCATDSESLIITKEDYNNFNKNSILISAKIISMLISSPIIFIGYSLKDTNVRKIIKDFANSLTDKELSLLEDRIILIEHKKDEEKIIEEKINDSELGCRLTVIETDNFIEIYKKISKINQGVSPSGVRRYQQVIKKLIVERGKDGTLDTLLISPDELDKIDSAVENKNLVVAIGDNKFIFTMPNLITYIYDYIFEDNIQNNDIMLRFIASHQIRARLPFIKYTNEDIISNSNLHITEKNKIRDRVKAHGNLETQIKKIPERCKIRFNSLDEILEKDYSKNKEQGVISYNIKNIELSEVEEYIKDKIEKLKQDDKIKVASELRRLILCFDLRKNLIKL